MICDKETDVKIASKALNNIGIQMFENDGTYRPFNEVMMDLGSTIKTMRDRAITDEEKKQFEILRTYVLESICGIRYVNQFKC